MRRAPQVHEPPRARRRAPHIAAACCLALVLALVAGCGSRVTAASGGTAPVSGGVATYALQPGNNPNYIFPFTSINYLTTYNLDNLQELLYRPLYWFGNRTQPTLSPALSLAYLPSYQGQQVTIRLKPYRWSNGEQVTASNVLFWIHMLQAVGANDWGGYVPNTFPGNVTNIRVISPTELTMDVKGPYSTTWFTYNELSQITPMPKAWDKTAGGKASDCTDNVADCQAVYNYLNAQSLNTQTYTTSPLWSVVDGPWRLKTYSTSGNMSFVLNKKYSGPLPAHHISVFRQVGYSSEQAEYNILQAQASGQPFNVGYHLDVGYLPTVDAPVPPAGSQVGANPLPGYRLTPVYDWGLNFFPYNFSSTSGAAPVFSQLYFRQAFQLLVNQAAIVDGPLHGYGKVSVGPVASYPQTFLSKTGRAGDPFPYNPARARDLLTANGWQVRPSGVSTCIRPGSAAGDCGAHIPAGKPLTFTLEYATGISWLESAVKQIASDAAQVGITVTLIPESFDTVINNSGACIGSPGKPCPWQFADWGAGWVYGPDYLPTGESIFQTNSAGNTGNYSNARNDALILQTLHSSSVKYLYQWQDYLARQLPVVMEPTSAQLIESINSLRIGPQAATLAITPETWYFVR